MAAMGLPQPLFAPATADAPPRVLVVAELGVNHDGRLARALELVDHAAAAGADAVKLQLFHPDRLLSADAELAAYQAADPAAADAHALLAGLMLPATSLHQIADAAHARSLAVVITPFSPADADALASLPIDAVKLASPDAVNPPLYRRAAALGLPMLVSTGTCGSSELEPVAGVVASHPRGGCLLQCTSAYPTDDADAALGGIAVLAERFGLPVGYSDHTTHILTGALAVAAGAVVIEKHLTRDRTAAGPDHAASLDPVRFREYVHHIRDAEAMLGCRAKRVLDVELDVRRVSRQSLCATRDLPAGHVLTHADLTVKRPGTGVPAADFDATLGRTLARPVQANRLLQPDDLHPRTP
jgi:N,N'-diacetyllegionaminate synthase